MTDAGSRAGLESEAPEGAAPDGAAGAEKAISPEPLEQRVHRIDSRTPGAGVREDDAPADAPRRPARRDAGSRTGRRSSLGKRLALWVIGGLVVALVLAAAAALWVEGHVNGGGQGVVTVQLGSLEGRSSVAADLGRAGVISDPWLFGWYLRYENYVPVKAGRYDFHRHEGYAVAMRDLRAGPKLDLARLTIPEGYTLGQIAARVGQLPGRSAQAFLDAVQSGTVRSAYEPAGSNNLEGLIFPDTYFVAPTENDQQILQRMVAQFDSVMASLGMQSPAPLPNGLTPYQTVIVASMVEREAKVPGDRGMVARVIENRLQRGMRLQIDATVLYAVGQQKTGITQSDLKVNSPYNTYVVTGLPPTPIASPGRASLLAALDPTPGTWLYYVLANADGSHAFATTAAEFERLRAQARAKGLLG